MDQPFYNKVEAAVLRHTTVSGDVVFGDGDNTVTVVKPTAIREEAPVQLKEGTAQLVQQLLQDFFRTNWGISTYGKCAAESSKAVY
jgi:hypothetical protein